MYFLFLYLHFQARWSQWQGFSTSPQRSPLSGRKRPRVNSVKKGEWRYGLKTFPSDATLHRGTAGSGRTGGHQRPFPLYFSVCLSECCLSVHMPLCLFILLLKISFGMSVRLFVYFSVKFAIFFFYVTPYLYLHPVRLSVSLCLCTYVLLF